jgi:hypothetical protein
MDAAPTTIVIAVSVGENVPVITCARPSRKSQIIDIRKSQRMKHGRDVHLLNSEFLNPATTVIQSGEV